MAFMVDENVDRDRQIVLKADQEKSTDVMFTSMFTLCIVTIVCYVLLSYIH